MQRQNQGADANQLQGSHRETSIDSMPCSGRTRARDCRKGVDANHHACMHNKEMLTCSQDTGKHQRGPGHLSLVETSPLARSRMKSAQQQRQEVHQAGSSKDSTCCLGQSSTCGWGIIWGLFASWCPGKKAGTSWSPATLTR